jgi:hypothetical protein
MRVLEPQSRGQGRRCKERLECEWCLTMRYWEIAVGVYTVPSDIYTTHITQHNTGAQTDCTAHRRASTALSR